MFLPAVPLLSGLAAALGLTGLCWYGSLSKEGREQADRLAAQYAKKLFNKALDELTKHQFEQVMAFVKRHLGS